MPYSQTKLYVNYATAISVIILIVAVATLSGAIRRTAAAWEWVVHTREVLERVEGTLALVNEAESLQRSLLLASDQEDREAFEHTLAAIPGEVSALQRLTSDNPRQQRALAAFGPLLDEHARALRQALALHGDEPRTSAPDFGAAKALHASIRRQVDGLRDEEERLLELRERQVLHDRRTVIGSLGAVAALAIVLVIFVRAIASRDAASISAERARLDATLRSIGDAVIATNQEGRVRFMNPVAEQLTGTSERQASGRALSEVLRLVDVSTRKEIDLTPVSREVAVSGVARPSIALSAMVPVEPDRGRDWIAGCHPVTQNGKPRGAVLALTEVTALRDAQRELQDANLLLERRVQERTEELADANVELRAFAHTVAHDLRAPLRNIQGFAAALLDDEAQRLSDSGRLFIERVGSGAQRMDELITGLLAYSQLTRSQLPLKDVSLDRVLQMAMEDLQAQIVATGARIEVADSLPAVRGNEGVLIQVFENLLGNAIKFVQPGAGPEIRISARVGDASARIAIADKGIGVAAAHREAVFGVFERLHTSEQYPGTGIGLAIVRRGMERMGGSVRILDAQGAGTVFELCLPLAANG